MLRQDSNRLDPDSSLNGSYGDSASIGGVDIQRELNRLEEMLLDSVRIPLTRRTLVDEEQLLEQLDLVRLNLPGAFAEAEEIVAHKEEILLQAEEYAQQIIEAAERRADQILDEMGIIREAEMEAAQIRQQVQRECEVMHEETLEEINQTRQEAQKELSQMRDYALGECEDIQNGADDYADNVLTNIEQQLGDMLRVIRNGRSSLQKEAQKARLPRPQASDDSTPPTQGRSKKG